MGAIDEGIYRYDEGDIIAPTMSEMLNLLGDSVRDRLAALEVEETVLAGHPSYEVRMSVTGGMVTVTATGSAPLASWVRWDLNGLSIPSHARPKRLQIGNLEVEDQEITPAQWPRGSFLVLPNGAVSLRHKSATPTTSATTWAASIVYPAGA